MTYPVTKTNVIVTAYDRRRVGKHYAVKTAILILLNSLCDESRYIEGNLAVGLPTTRVYWMRPS
jgi:hypothetical protein